MKITKTKIFEKNILSLKKSNPNVLPSLVRKIALLEQWKVLRESLVWYSDIYKIRVWKYRLIYTIQNWVLMILLAVRKREIAYNNLDEILKNIGIKK